LFATQSRLKPLPPIGFAGAASAANGMNVDAAGKDGKNITDTLQKFSTISVDKTVQKNTANLLTMLF
jgi:hypothetical protein